MVRKENVLEKDVERIFVKKMSEAGWAVIKIKGSAGWPDRQVLGYNGFSFFVELKRPKDGKLSAIQKVVHRNLKLRGFIVEIVKDCSNEEIRRILDIVETAQISKNI